MHVGTLEEIIDDEHAIVSTQNGPEYYVSIMSFVDKDVIEPGCAVLLHHKVGHFSLFSLKRKIQNVCI
jgi:26S proteasome regulatory subunit T2